MALRRLLSGASILWLAALPAEALQILPLQDDRIISVTFQRISTQTETPGPGFPNFNKSVFFVGAGDAHQSSSIATTQMSGTGSDFTDGAGDTSGRSVFDITFQVDEIATYALTGSVFGDGATLPSVVLSDPSTVLFEPVFPGGVGPYPFAGSGVLAPGVSYRLLVASMHGAGMGSQGNDWSFAFSIALPEPTTGAAFTLATLLIAAGQRRGRAARPGSS